MRLHCSRSIILVLVLLTSLNLGWQFYRTFQAARERQRIFEDSGVTFCYFGPSVDERARMLIDLCVVVAFLGSCLNGFKSLVLTVIGLTGAAITYIHWRRAYLRLVEILGGELEDVENIGGLMNANYLDIAVAAVITFLILIHFRAAFLRLRTVNDSCNSWIG